MLKRFFFFLVTAVVIAFAGVPFYADATAGRREDKDHETRIMDLEAKVAKLETALQDAQKELKNANKAIADSNERTKPFSFSQDHVSIMGSNGNQLLLTPTGTLVIRHWYKDNKGGYPFRQAAVAAIDQKDP
jgi:hypothetical protein